MSLHYRETDGLIEKAEAQQFTERFYEEGLEHLKADRWIDAAHSLERVVQVRPDYKLAYASWLYALGMSGVKGERWC